MNETSNIVALRQPAEIGDPLTNILRSGARQLLAQAVEIEVEAFLATVKDLKLADGRARVVRHGYGPARTIATGIGPVEVARAKIRDRGTAGDCERIRFSSVILPLWARRTRSLDALLPVASPRTATRCWPSTTFLPSIGIICARPTPSKACSRPCDTGRCGRKDRCRRRPPG